MQKFVPQSRVGIFRNERTRSTPLDPKLTFLCVLYHLCAFGTVGCLTKLVAKRAELVLKFMPRSRVRIFRNERNRSNPLDPKLTFWCISYHLGAFGTVWLPYELGAKRAELVQKFVPQSRVGIFLNERTRSTPLDPKLMFWYVSYYLGAFGTVWLPYETRGKTGRTSAIVRVTKSRQNFSQRTQPIQPIGP